MAHRHRILLRSVLTKGLQLGQHCFFLVFPLSLTMSALEFALRPRSQPTFVDVTDLAMVFFFFLGLLALSALHAGIVLQINAVRKRQRLAINMAVTQGIERGIRVFSVILLYSAITLIGLLCFLLPGIYLGVTFYFASFLAVLQDDSLKLPWYTQFKNYFSESFRLVRGHWWLTFGMLVIITAILVILEQLCFLLLPHNLVLGTIFCAVARAVFLPFWYGWVLVLLFELKKSH